MKVTFIRNNTRLFRILVLIVFIVCLTQVNLLGQTIINITDEIKTDTSLFNTTVNIYGKSELHLLTPNEPLINSQVNLVSEDGWLFFEFIRPEKVIDNYIDQIKINNSDAVPGSNLRVVQYKNGTVVVPHSPNYTPLTVFQDSLFLGTSMEIGIHEYYKGTGLLSEMNDTISSFILKRGYMATFAEDEKGTGFSKVYIAQDADLEIKKLPYKLNNRISFVRVLPWIWANKKGYSGADNFSADTLRCGWRYDWNNTTKAEANVEYVPMRHNSSWNSYHYINQRNDCTHALGFNEPDRPDQANMTVEQAIAQWPKLLESGLRLGSPAPSDGGLNWLYSFMSKAEELNYRVDFVAVHFYKGGWTASQYYNWLKEIYEKTGKPIWITEWNNGANWTCCEPTYSEQARTIKQFITMLDTASFVERYCFFDWVGETRRLISYSEPLELTEAGIVYRDNNSQLAYYDPKGLPLEPGLLKATSSSSMEIELNWKDNSDNELGFKIERSVELGEFEHIARVGSNTTSYTDKSLLSSTVYTYRVVAYNSIGESEYSVSATDTTFAGKSILPQDNWSLLYVDSQELNGEDGAATNAFDGDESTIWHTEWDNASPNYPHELQIDLGNEYKVAGLTYLPRQDGNINGTIAGYKIFVSSDTSDWGEPVASGVWLNNNNKKTIEFNTVDGRYLKFYAASEVNGKVWASAAEINLIVDGKITSVETESENLNLPTTYNLSQNFPNPFNPTTTIKYSIPSAQFVLLKVFNLLGKEISTLVNEEQSAGNYYVKFDASELASGIYIYSLFTEGYSESKKLILLK